MTDITPTQEVFDEIRTEAIKIWEKYDDQYGYATEKINRVNAVKNYADNAMIFYRMFDSSNQSKLREALSEKALYFIKENNNGYY
jgi:hypothetical protein